MKILYAGDSPVGGAANYLLGILKSIRADVLHLPPSETLQPKTLNKKFDAIILSDFPKSRTPLETQKAIARQVEGGTGLLMIGGWASFAAIYGKWKGSEIEKLLPVDCLGRDDRTNLPGGGLVVLKNKHPMFRSLSFKNPPVLCGLNQIKPKKKSLTVLTAGEIRSSGSRLALGTEYPLLVVDRAKRTAALATDLAPHWCGGLVDWGKKRVKLPVAKGIQIEVGNLYVEFVASLVRWLAGKGKEAR